MKYLPSRLVTDTCRRQARYTTLFFIVQDGGPSVPWCIPDDRTASNLLVRNCPFSRSVLEHPFGKGCPLTSQRRHPSGHPPLRHEREENLRRHPNRPDGCNRATARTRRPPNGIGTRADSHTATGSISRLILVPRPQSSRRITPRKFARSKISSSNKIWRWNQSGRNCNRSKNNSTIRPSDTMA